MKMKQYRIVAAVLAVSALVGLTGCARDGSMEEGMGGALSEQSGHSANTSYIYRTDITPFREAMFTTSNDYLLLVNKQVALGEKYIPASLSALPGDITLYGKDISLEFTAALAAEALLREIRACGYGDIYITSAYRSYAYQKSLFNTYMKAESDAHPDWSQAQLEARVLTYSAMPGASEHQTGLCMDLISDENVVLDESFADNPAYTWLCENAHHFGFILRYPKGQEDVTGYTYEPWHYRFVGVKAATEIRKAGVTLEEYLRA